MDYSYKRSQIQLRPIIKAEIVNADGYRLYTSSLGRWPEAQEKIAAAGYTITDARIIGSLL